VVDDRTPRNTNDGIVCVVVWKIRYLEGATRERDAMPPAERVALDRAAEKLEAFGPQLPFPHQSSVRQGAGLRELRPRAGRSAWRAFYQRVGDVFIIAAVGPEAEADLRGFERAVTNALTRLEEVDRS
jgi:hypothetical protein